MQIFFISLLLSLSFQFTSVSAFAKQPSLGHFSQVSEGIYRGGRPDFAALPLLLDYHIKTVIDLQGGDHWLTAFEPGEKPEMIEKEEAISLELGFQFANYPLSSVKKVNAEEEKWIGEVLALMADPLNRPVFIHCEHGADRTGLVIALYRVFYEGWTAKTAHDEMMKMGHGNLGNQILTGAMDRYFRKVTKGH